MHNFASLEPDTTHHRITRNIKRFKDEIDIIDLLNRSERFRNTVAIRDGITRGNPNQVVINESDLYSSINGEHFVHHSNKIGASLKRNTPRLVPISTFIKLYLNASTPPFEGLFSGQLKAP